MNPCKPGEALIQDGSSGRWLHFQNPVASFQTGQTGEVMPLIREIHHQVKAKRLYAAGFISYDAAPGMDNALSSRRDETTPLVHISLYPTPRILEPSVLVPEGTSGRDAQWKPCISQNEYECGVGSVREYIQKGHTYQVNFTYRMETGWTGDPWDLFCRINAAQNARYGAFLETEDLAVCSASPELFFTLEGKHIKTSPMKGTSPRGKTLEEDRYLAEALFRSEKNRAENLMIVDMIRNDLGRIARTGTVRVTDLFRIEKYPTLWQMTTDVEAETDAEIPQILENLFPCASITGAPKYRTMEIIKELETTPRGLYTGTIGFWGPDGRAQFNVAIRTAVIDRVRHKGMYGTGGGIVWDSTTRGELEESQTKTAILKQEPLQFDLLETLKWAPEEGYYLLERHLDRLGDSAEYFTFPFDREMVKTFLIQKSGNFPEDRNLRVRLLLKKTGELLLESTPLTESQVQPAVWTLKTADSPVDLTNPLIYHKTTKREMYNRFRTEQPEADDVILWNKKGEVTETTICNIVAVLNGTAYTPPVSSGLLGGTLRKELLEKGEIKERIITLDDLANAEEIYLINSVRGRIRSVIDSSSDRNFHK